MSRGPGRVQREITRIVSTEPPPDPLGWTSQELARVIHGDYTDGQLRSVRRALASLVETETIDYVSRPRGHYRGTRYHHVPGDPRVQEANDEHRRGFAEVLRVAMAACR